MNRVLRNKRLAFFLVVLAWFFLCPVADALADGETGNWRSTYDQVMMWVNFFIIVFILVKFGRAPIGDFLEGRKMEIRLEMKRHENAKDEILERVKAAQRDLDEGEERFERLKTRIINQGEREKDAIVSEAKQQSRIMLEAAERKVGSRILQAKETFRGELVDTAFESVLEKIPGFLMEEDHRNLIDLYLKTAGTP
jgi:F-type H+-transporting ATPase subunit b